MLVDVGDVLSQAEVILGVRLVSDEPQEIEPGEQRCRQLYVGLRRLLDVVATERRISSCQDRHACIQGRHYTGLHVI